MQTQLEHILLRPDTYIGSIESETDARWLFDPSTSAIELRRCTFIPGLFKIFDEILVNAADNKQRDPSMSSLRVSFHPTQHSISVYNDGRGIPIEIHREHGVYVPELIFGHLLTSSNYDDSDKRTVGGRNGYGAKLANIFSSHFTVTTHDARLGKTYTQTWSHNMQHKGEPIIKACKGKDYTEVSFTPDYARFGCEGLTADMLHLMMRRVWDIAGTSGGKLQVLLNDAPCKCPSFSHYVAMFQSPSAALVPAPSPSFLYERCSPRWELCVGLSDGHFTHMSWVNSIATSRGGSHVAHICDQLVKGLTEYIERKYKKVKLKAAHVKAHLALHLNCLIDNPSFDTQTKECLTTKKAAFGSTCELSPAFLKAVCTRTPLVEAIVHFASFKESEGLKKGDGRKSSRISGIPKLDDANDAGTKQGHLCTLILTEGDSAKALAVSGLSVIGRDRYGVFPLRGKLLNVREASAKQIMDNGEVTALKKILGLQQGKAYTSADSLRYGHVMIMTDQDHDGSHIKGLIINLFATFWPSLLRLPGFLTEFITPIVKVRHTRTKADTAFFTLPEFEAWKAAQGPSAVAHYSIKYYKGLGTSTSQEAKEYFAAISRHQLHFTSDPGAEAAIELAFGRQHADARKEWLGRWTRELYLDQSLGSLSYSDFVHRELILFSVASNQRAIPSLVDGLKPGQRKILFSAFLKRLTREIKVAQLAGYVAEKSAYHHGEAALTSTIVGMAQSFTGSNNLNLLYPSGMFGTRLQGGKDAASARYIFTHLCPVARAVFPAVDDGVLRYLSDDGLDIEPEHYLPVLPMVLVNGSSGIGTGWSSSVPNYNPRDLVANLCARMRGCPLQPLHPWYRGFDGAMQPMGGGRYQHTGRVEEVDATTLLISELPIGVWTADYKAVLEAMMEAGEVRGYREYHTDTRVAFVVQCTAEQMAQARELGLYKRFKLLSSLTTSNMVLFDADGRLQRYDSPEAILEAFYAVRLDGYRRRKVEEMRRVGEDVRRLSNKARFIVAVVAGEMAIRGVKKAALLQALVKGGYDAMPRGKGKGRAKEAEAEGEGEGEEEEKEGDVRMGDYEYLLGLPLWALTLEKVEEVKAAKALKEREWAALKATTEEEMWERDLQAFLTALDAHEEEERKREEGQVKAKAADKGKGKGKKADTQEPPRGVLVPPPAPAPEKEAKEKKPRAAKKEAGEAEVTATKGAEVKAGKGEKAVVRRTAGKAVRAKRKADSEDEEENDVDDADGSDVELLDSPPPQRAARPARAAAAKKSYTEVDDDEEDEEAKEAVDEDDDGEEEYRVDADAADDDEDFALLTKKTVASPPAPKAKVAGKAKSQPTQSKAVSKVVSPRPRVVSPPHQPASKVKVASPPPAKLAAVKAAPKVVKEKAAAAKAEGEEGEGMSLSERLALRMQTMALGDAKRSPPAKAVKPAAAAKRPLAQTKAAGALGVTPEAKKTRPAVKAAKEEKEAREVRAKRAVAVKYAEESSDEEVEEVEELSDSDEDYRD